MTNKPTWEDELKTLCEKYCNCIDAYTGRHMIDPSCTYHQVWEEGIIEQFISTKLAEKDEMWSKWKVLAETMDNAPVGHRVTIKHLLGEDEWTLTRRNKTN